MSFKGILGFLPLILIVVIMYLLMIRPQNKKRKEADQMRKNLSVGDNITTIGGIKGKVSAVHDETIVIKLADSQKIEVTKWAVGTVDSKQSAYEPEPEPEPKKEPKTSKPKKISKKK